MQVATCPTCRQPIGGTNHQLVAGISTFVAQSNDQPGMIDPPVEQLGALSHTVRQLSPANYRFLHFLVHSSLLLSCLLSRSGDHMKHIIHLENDWRVLRGLLNADDEQVGIAIHHVVARISECNNLNQSGIIQSSDARIAWENAFEGQVGVVSRNLNDLVRKAREITQKTDAITLQQEIDEAVVFPNDEGRTAYEKQNLAHLLRSRGAPSRLSLRAHYFSNQANLDRYPLINLVFQSVEREHSVSLMKYLGPFLSWIRLVQSKLEFKVKRGDAVQMTISDFLNRHADVENITKMFERFQKGWNKTKGLLDRFECEQLPDIPDIDGNCSITLCVLENRDVGAIVSSFLRMFASIQNGFMEQVLDLSAHGLRALLPFQISNQTSAIPKVSLLESDQSQVVSISWNAIESLCYANPQYQHGSELLFDYDRLQLFWGGNIVNRCKILTASNLPQTFRYAAEPFFHNMTLLESIRVTIPQRALSLDMTDRINNDRMIQAEASLRALDVVLYFMEKTKPRPDTIIRDFCSQYLSRHDYQGLEGTCILTVQLDLIVGLYEMIEAMVSTKTVDSTPPAYKVDLPAELQQSVLRSIEESQIKLSDLLTALNRYLFRFLSTTMKDPDDKLCNSLGVCWPDQIHLEDEWFSVVPIGDVEIRHTYSLRLLVLSEQERLLQEKAWQNRNAALSRQHGKAAGVQHGKPSNLKPSNSKPKRPNRPIITDY
jgi:hypothetical protein